MRNSNKPYKRLLIEDAIIALIFVIIAVLIIYANNPNFPIQIQKSRDLTLNLVENHIKKCGNKCDAVKIKEGLQFTTISTGPFDNNQIRAFAISANNVDYGRIVLNSNVEWSEWWAVRTLLHEALHTSGKCGVDRYKATVPVCSLNGIRVYQFDQIDDWIDDHFSKELSDLDRRVWIK